MTTLSVSPLGACSCCCELPVRPISWSRGTTVAIRLAVASIAWMSVEAAVGLAAGVRAGSPSLIGWALSSVIEACASVLIIWRFTGRRRLTDDSERTAQRGIAALFWTLAPVVAALSINDLARGHRPETSLTGMVLACVSIAVMPLLGRAKRSLARRLDSRATRAEGAQNDLCAYLAAGVLLGLVANAAFGAWWLDPVVGVVVGLVALSEGRGSWRGQDCC